METFGEEMEPNLITGPPASRSVIENLKRLLTQRQHSRESDSDAHKENNGALHSTGSELDQSELSFYSHLTSSSESDSDDSTDIHIWTAGAAFQLQAANNGALHGGVVVGGKKKSNGNSTSATGGVGVGKNGGGSRRRRSFRNHSASTSSSSPSPPPSSHCKRRRKPASTTTTASATPLPLKNIILSKLTPEIDDETTRVTSTNPKRQSDLSSDDFLSSPIDDETAGVTSGQQQGIGIDGVRKHKNDGNLRKRRREYINAKIRRNEWTEINTPPQTGAGNNHQNQKVDDLETAMDLSNSSKIRKTDPAEQHEPGMVQSQIQIVVTAEKSDEEQIVE